MTRSSGRRVLRRSLYLRRRSLAVLASIVAVFAVVSAVRPPAPASVAVWAAAADLPAGTTLSASTLTPLSVPADAVPGGAALEASALVGATLAGPVTARTILTAADVGSAQTLAAPGFVIVALPLRGDALASLLSPGARIDLFDPADTGSVLATDVRVVGAPEPEQGAFAAASDPVVLVEIPRDTAGRVASAAEGGGVVVAVR